MASFTTPKTWTAGSVSAAEMNTDVRDNVTNLDERLTLHGLTSNASVQVVKTARYGVSLTITGEAVADATDKAISFDASEEWDDDGFHSTVTNPSRITIPEDGTYDVDGFVDYEANGTGRRELWIELNSVTEYNRVRLSSTGSAAATAITTSRKLELSAGDYLILRTRQSSGTSLDVAATFQCHRIAV